jgi:hypothetical protein
MKQTVSFFRSVLDMRETMRPWDYVCLALLLAAFAASCYGVYEMLFDPTIMPHIVNDANPPSN